MVQAGTTVSGGFGRIARIVGAKRLGASNSFSPRPRTASGTDALWRSGAQLVPKGEGDLACRFPEHGTATGRMIGSPAGCSARFHPDGRVCHLCRC